MLHIQLIFLFSIEARDHPFKRCRHFLGGRGLRNADGSRNKMPTSLFGRGGGILVKCQRLLTGGEGSKIAKIICPRLNWMVPKIIAHAQGQKLFYLSFSCVCVIDFKRRDHSSITLAIFADLQYYLC